MKVKILRQIALTGSGEKEIYLRYSVYLWTLWYEGKTLKLDVTLENRSLFSFSFFNATYYLTTLVNTEINLKLKTSKKKPGKIKASSPESERPHSASTTPSSSLERKKRSPIKKKYISSPISSSVDGLTSEGSEAANIKGKLFSCVLINEGSDLLEADCMGKFHPGRPG